MALGGATKKLQKVADMGEELYGKMNELREQIAEMRETVQETDRRVAALENKLDQQAAILEALAASEDLDVDEILTDVAIEEAEPAITQVGADERADDDGTTTGSEEANSDSDEATTDSDEATTGVDAE